MLFYCLNTRGRWTAVTLYLQVVRLRTKRPWQSEWILMRFSFSKCTPIRKSKMKFCDLSRLSRALYLFTSLSQSSLLCEPLSHSHSSQNKPPQVPLSLNHEDAVTYVIQWRLFLCKHVFRVNISCMEYWQLTFTDNDRCLYKAVRFKGWSKNWPKERRNWGKSKQWKIDLWLIVLKTGNCNWFSSLLQ